MGTQTFKPNKRQERACLIAQVLWTNPATRQVGDILQATVQTEGKKTVVHRLDGDQRVPVELPWPGPAITKSEWEKWEGQAGFADWWFNRFPTAGGLTKTDLIRMDAAFWREMSIAVEKGDSKALDLYARLRAIKGDPAADADELAAIIERGASSGWGTGSAAEA